MRIHWVPYEIYFKSTQIDPGFYIYTLERSFCLIDSIIINIRYTLRGPMVYLNLGEYSESYMINTLLQQKSVQVITYIH